MSFLNFWLLVSLICFGIGGIFTMQRQLQMFQQNSYYSSRYIKWVKSSVGANTVFSLMFFIITAVLAFVNATEIFLPIIAVCELIIRILRQTSLQKKSIKKLVYTARVKRLNFTACLIFIIIILLCAFFPNIDGILAILIILPVHFPQIILLTSNLANKPIENTINNYYISDAKKILFSHKNLITVGVTGSYGKTSVKFFLNRILNEKYNTTCTPESFNTPMGIVRTVRQFMKPQTEIFVAEMGAKNIGDIKELCDLCNPNIGIITAVGPQHLETFKTIENIANTKFELADHVLNNNGKIYINFESVAAKERSELISDKSNVVSFGLNSDLDCYAKDIKSSVEGTSFTAVYKDISIPLTCKLLGKHNITNILGAVAIAIDLNINEKQIRFAVASLKAPEHRLELKPFLNGSVLIDDAYNSNPEGSVEAVNVLGSFKDMRRIIVTPGLVELGDKEYEYNYHLGQEASKNCDDIILVGLKRAVPLKDAIDKTDFNKSRLLVVENFKQALEKLNDITDSNTVVLFENDLPDNYAG